MSFYGVTDLQAYILGSIGIVLLPGPNSLYVLSIASAQGIKTGYHAAYGVFVGDSILLLCTVFGAASLTHTYPAVFALVQYLGALYLAWIGWQLLTSASQYWKSKKGVKNDDEILTVAADIDSQPALSPSASHLQGRSKKPQKPFTRALIISLLNPKAIMFLLSFFVQFVDPNYSSPAVPFLILSIILMGISFAYLSALILAGTRLASIFQQRPRLSATLTASVGILFLGFAFKLGLTKLT